MCECCDRTRVGPDHAWFDPLCLHCGARLIWKIQRKQITRDERVSRCRAVLQDWMKYGHSEAEIRRLVKLDEMPVAPELSTALSTGRGKRGG
jgi:hypothetical protein